MSKASEILRERMGDLKTFIDIVRGRNDIVEQLSVLINPKNPKTSANLSASQTIFVQDALWLGDAYPEFKSMKDDADHLLNVSLSKDGFGVEKTISLAQSMNQSHSEIEHTSRTTTLLPQTKPPTPQGGTPT